MNPQVLLDGLVAGSMIGLGAVGVTLTYSILRFPNFAHGEFIAWGAYLTLVLSGAIGALVGGTQPVGPFSFGWALPLAGLAGMALTAVLALLLDWLLFKRLRGRKAAMIIIVMASFGASMALRSALEFIFTDSPEYYSRELQIAMRLGGGLKATPDQLLALGVTAAVVAGLFYLMNRTPLGRSMRAVSENPSLAGVAGVDVAQVVRFVWIIGAALACGAGVMAGLLVQIRPYMGFDLLLPLFSAAILGGIGSVPGAIVGGLIGGARRGAGGRSAWRAMALGRGLRAVDRDPAGAANRHFREARMTLQLAAYGAFFLTMALTYAIICLGLNVQWGQTGLFNVGIAAFVAVGAYASAILTTPDAADRFGGFSMPIVVGWAGGMLCAGVVAFLIAWLTIRLRADYLAITTFGVAVVVQLAMLNLQPLTGGPFGIGFIPRPFAGWQENSFMFSVANLAVVAVVTVAVYVFLETLVRSPWGRALRAVREDEVAAQALGKSPKWLRIQAFTLGGAIMGLAGAVQGHFIGFIAPDNYLPMLTFQAWAMLIVGGSGNNRGAILGAVVVWAVWAGSGSAIGAVFPPGSQARAASLQVVLIGVVLCIILLLRPQGILREVRTVSRYGAAADKDGKGTVAEMRADAPAEARDRETLQRT